jgi:hypothetical protein
MKRQRFTEVCQKIHGAVVAGIEVKFVPDGFRLELAMEFRSAFFKPKVIFIAAVEIDRQPRCPNLCSVLLCEHERTVLVPVAEVKGIAEYFSKRPTRRCRSLPRRFHNERGTLTA